MNEFVLNFKATGAEEFGEAAEKTARSMDKQEATAKRMARWQNELANMRRREREEAFKQLPAEQQLEKLLERRAQLEERIARAGQNQLRLTALKVQQARNEARIRNARGEAGGRLADLADEIPGVARVRSLIGRAGAAVGLSGAGLAIGGVIAGTVVAIGNLVRVSVRSAQALTDMSHSTQVARDDLQALSYGASAVSGDLNVVLATFKALKQAQGELTSGLGRSQQKAKLFEILGLSTDKTPLENFTELTKRLKDGTLTNEEYAAAVRLMGEAFADLLPYIKDGLGQYIEEHKEANLKIREGTIELLDAIGDAWDKKLATIGASIKKWSMEVAGGIVAVGQVFFRLGLLGGVPLPGGKEGLEKAFEDLNTYWSGGTGKEAADQEDKETADKRKQHFNESERERLNQEARDLLGDDADDVIEEWDESNATIDSRKSALRRHRRQKNREKRSSGGEKVSMPTADALQRIGLFVGDTGLRNEMSKQSQLLSGIKAGIERVDRSLNKEA